MVDIAKNCKSCAFFEAKAQECHRYAPRPVNVDDQKKMRWPATPPIGWCGEYQDKNAPAAEEAPAPAPAAKPAAAPPAKPAAPAAKPAPPAAK